MNDSRNFYYPQGAIMRAALSFFKTLPLIMLLALAGCSNWVYRVDIPQGNFLEQKDVDKLRIEMSKEQVIFVIGNPVAKNSFNDNVWHYLYTMTRGNGNEFRTELVIFFDKDEKLLKIEGDFEVPENFNIPLEQ